MGRPKTPSQIPRLPGDPLIFLIDNFDPGAFAMSQVQQPPRPPNPEARRRAFYRVVASLFFLVFAYLSLEYVIYEIIPVPLIFLVMSLLGLLGLIGVNVFAGGPLDRTKDPN